MLLAVVLSGMAHAVVGYSLSLLSRDFSAMLGYIFLYVLIFALPTILLYVNVIPPAYDWVLLISPAHSAQLQLSYAINGVQSTGKLLVSYAYLAALIVLLIRVQVAPGFRRHVVRG